MRIEGKQVVRREMRRILANLDARWASVAHIELCHHLIRLVESGMLGEVLHVLAWIPCFPGEVDLTPFIASMLRERHVYLPRLSSQGTMEFRRVREDWAANLEKGERGILQPQPSYGDPFESVIGERVLVVVPGLAFDRAGGRLGRGGGYYDRFLAERMLATAVRVGVCWEMQVVPSVPTDTHDLPMHWLCHEDGILNLSEGYNSMYATRPKA